MILKCETFNCDVGKSTHYTFEIFAIDHLSMKEGLQRPSSQSKNPFSSNSNAHLYLIYGTFALTANHWID